jgi:hypothetical protein
MLHVLEIKAPGNNKGIIVLSLRHVDCDLLAVLKILLPLPVLWIRDVYAGRIFSIPDPGQKDSGSQIRIKEFKYF